MGDSDDRLSDDSADSADSLARCQGDKEKAAKILSSRTLWLQSF